MMVHFVIKSAFYLSDSEEGAGDLLITGFLSSETLSALRRVHLMTGMKRRNETATFQYSHKH